MKQPTRLTLVATAFAAAVAAGLAIGTAVGPVSSASPPEAPAPEGQGVVASRSGYRLVLSSPTFTGGAFRFRIDDEDGQPQTRFTPVHEKDLHLIVVNRELTEYHHVHPVMAADGTWGVDLPALPAGSFRAIADFRVEHGPRLALGSDFGVTGPYRPTELAEPAARASVDGFDIGITARAGDGGEVTIAMTVSRDGAPVSDLQPYLGANGHLVAIRAGDLAYAHVHPVDAHPDGEDAGPPADGTVVFDATLDAAGRYGLFFDFQVAGTVHTATFTFDQGPVHGTPTMEH